ncbi:MAG: helix-turn-helix domain-containing protein [Salinivirgaceae bacterium]|nr:helix-turn-helix domain-containing protein [Salinivirgaceae bacterium]
MDATTFDQRKSLVDLFLLEQLKGKTPSVHIERMTHIVNLINTSGGGNKITQLASEACLSRKQFERVFQNVVGTSPKQFLKIIRFQNALHTKTTNKHINLTQLAHQCAYYDHSHMINEFVQIAGKTPRQFFSENQTGSDYF